jgi:chemosensory pili system protein ChpA (sensor histidine kinase/response regulator)
MVGLLEFGEVAWTLEQTLNGWLAQGQAPQAEDIALIAQTQRTLQDWVARLRADARADTDFAPIQLETAAPRHDAGLGPDFELIDLRAAGLGELMRPVDATEPDPIDLDSIEIIEPVAATDPIDIIDVLEFSGTADGLDAIDAIEPTLPMADELTVQIGSRTLPDSLYRIFLEEADDCLETLTALHAAWQANPHWADAIAAQEAARAAHSLMGNSRLVALPQVGRLAGALEDFLGRVAAHPGRPTEEQQRCVAAVLDGLRAVLHQFAAGTDPVSDDILQSRADDLAQGLIEETSVEETTVEICDEIDTDLLGLFAAEADELMPQIGDALQRWRSQPADRTPSVVLMRALHTIKGSARMAGAMRLGQALHDMETRIETAPLDAPASSALSLIDELIGCHDRALALYESIRAGQAPAQDTAVSSFAASSSDAQSVAPSGVLSASLSSVDATPGTQSLVRVRADLLDRLVNEAGEVSIARARLDNELGVIRQSMTELAENVSRLRLQLREIELAADSQIQARPEQVSQPTQTDSAFDPLEFDRYTRFQELTRMLAESVNDVATVHQNALRGLDDAARDLAHQTQVTRELQHDLMRIRMVRFGSIADRLHRVVRQSAAESDHQARLELVGVDTEVDRSVLERMAGPMEHLLRNAVAHGIETAQVREQAGKAPEGVVSVDVRQDGHALVMTFADDGGGLDLARIRRTALDRGLITPEARLSERELAQLIFLPGFSTASQLSALAGRGVGLDAVRAEVAAMGGRIELETTPGQGTRFVAHLPVSLAVTQVVVLTAGQTRIAVPSNLVEQVMHLQPDPIAQAYSQHAVTVGEAAVPLYYLGSLLELRGARPQAQRQSPIVLLRSGSQRIALHVDHVAPSQEVVVKQVGPQLVRVTGMAGATVLGNGEIVLILDPVQIAATGRSSTAGQGDTASFAATGIDVVPTVMVVDDSVTVRKVTQRLLAREGYQVVLARDGLDALRQLQDTVPDVMLLDIEMPRMDGFELIGQMRADARWRDVPVIMISSRTAEKHREHAQSLGVLAFLGKPFDEADLLERLRALTTRPVPSV